MYIGDMKRATITVSSDTEAALNDYIRDQEATPTLTAVVQAALNDFLAARGYLQPPKPFRIEPSPKPSGKRDISRNHDKYIAEAVYSHSKPSSKKAR